MGCRVAFNRRHRRSGHLFQNRYQAVVLDVVGGRRAFERFVREGYAEVSATSTFSPRSRGRTFVETRRKRCTPKM